MIDIIDNSTKENQQFQSIASCIEFLLNTTQMNNVRFYINNKFVCGIDISLTKTQVSIYDLADNKIVYISKNDSNVTSRFTLDQPITQQILLLTNVIVETFISKG